MSDNLIKMNNNNPSNLLNPDKDFESQYGKHWIGDSPNRNMLEKSFTKNIVHFRHCLQSVDGNSYTNYPWINHTIDNNGQFDYVANSILTLYTSKFKVPGDIFGYIKQIQVLFGETKVLFISGYQLEMIMMTRPEEYRKMLKYNDGFTIPIQSILMDKDPICLQFPIKIQIQMYNYNGFKLLHSQVTYEGYRSINECYKRNQLCSKEKSIYTYYFTNMSWLTSLKTPKNIPIYMVYVRDKSKNKVGKFKLGGIDMLPTSNPYFKYNDVLIPRPDTFCYISRPRSSDNLSNLTGIVIGSDDITLDVESATPIDIDVMFITYNSVSSSPNNKTSLMAPIDFYKLAYEPQKGSPLYKINDHKFIEGYWASNSPLYDSDNTRLKYNMPLIGDKNEPVNPDFLTKLKLVMEKFEPKKYMGFSNCRVCDKPNGGDEYEIDSNGTTFIFPNGILHYYEEHQVQPSNEFVEFITKLE